MLSGHRSFDRAPLTAQRNRPVSQPVGYEAADPTAVFQGFAWVRNPVQNVSFQDRQRGRATSAFSRQPPAAFGSEDPIPAARRRLAYSYNQPFIHLRLLGSDGRFLTVSLGNGPDSRKGCDHYRRPDEIDFRVVAACSTKSIRGVDQCADGQADAATDLRLTAARVMSRVSGARNADRPGSGG
jgi:hypothetical protein